MMCCRYMAATDVPVCGKHEILNRLKRHFAVSNVPLQSVAAIANIFRALLKVRSGQISGQCSQRTAPQPICQASVMLQLY